MFQRFLELKDIHNRLETKPLIFSENSFIHHWIMKLKDLWDCSQSRFHTLFSEKSEALGFLALNLVGISETPCKTFFTKDPLITCEFDILMVGIILLFMNWPLQIATSKAQWHHEEHRANHPSLKHHQTIYVPNAFKSHGKKQSMAVQIKKLFDNNRIGEILFVGALFIRFVFFQSNWGQHCICKRCISTEKKSTLLFRSPVAISFAHVNNVSQNSDSAEETKK